MRILLLSPVFPYPPEDGDRIRIFNILKGLKKNGHIIHLVSFIREGEEESVKHIKKYARTVDTICISGKEIMKNAIKGFFSRMPLNAAAYKSAEMEKAVVEAAQKYRPEAVFTYRLRMAQYAQKLNLPQVIDYVDSLALFMKRSAAYERNLLYFLYYIFDAPRVLKYERETAKSFSKVFINSEEDRDYIGSENILTAANGARPAERTARRKKTGVFTAGFLGNFAYRPNFEGANFLIKKVWKKTSGNDNNIRLIIAGKGSQRFKNQAGPGIILKDFVPDVPAELSGWDISVIPVRYGAGRQNKLMDCWACNVPVVATPFAASGVYGRDGKELLISSTPGEFAGNIRSLMNDRALRKKLAAGGASALKKHFSWEKTGKLISVEIVKAVKNFEKRK